MPIGGSHLPEDRCVSQPPLRGRAAPVGRSRLRNATPHKAHAWISLWVLSNQGKELQAQVQNWIQELGASLSSPDLQSWQSTYKSMSLTQAPATIWGGHWKQQRDAALSGTAVPTGNATKSTKGRSFHTQGGGAGGTSISCLTANPNHRPWGLHTRTYFHPWGF